MATNRMKAIEDFMCDTLDELFSDSVKVQKEFDATKECRSIQMQATRRSPDDQHSMLKTTIDYSGLRFNRSDVLSDIDKIYKKFPIYNTFVDNSFAISVVLVYITSPLRTTVGSRYGWTYTATFEITST